MKNRENTKRKLLDAVGKIIINEGFSGLGVNKVAKSAAVSKILIYRYFGNFSQLLKTYVLEKDFWNNPLSDEENSQILHLTVREQVSKILSDRSASFYNHCEMEAMLVNEISNRNTMVSRIIREESLAEQPTYFNVVSKLLSAGTDHLILAEQGRLPCRSADLSSNRKSELLRSIGQIVEWTLGK